MPRSERRPWSPFYWGDWLSDPGVQSMTFDEQGRYLRFLALTNQGPRPGISSEDEVRQWACYSIEEWPSHREAFLRCFSTDLHGRWIQKRTVEEFKAADERRALQSRNGKMGMRKRWHSKELNNQAITESITCHSHSHSHRESLPGSSSLRSSSPSASEAGLRREWIEAFETEFWPRYPRKTAKKAALRRWVRLYVPGRDLTFHERRLGRIDDVLDERLLEWRGREPDKIPHPATFLNAEDFDEKTEGAEAR